MGRFDDNFYIVIMAGGSGTRMWPISRCDTPKQLHNLCSQKSLICETYERVEGLVPRKNIYVSLVRNVLEATQKQLPKIPKENFIVEPEAKNTAPAIALAATYIAQENPEAIIATIASDHTIENPQEFRKCLLSTFNFVSKNPDYFTTIGIRPTRPDTGFGYIQIGKKFAKTPFYQVEQFVEKPDQNKALQYLKSGKYVWNASYFTFQANKMLMIYKKHAPKISNGIAAIKHLLRKNNSQNEIARIYRRLPAQPFDTAIAEKTNKIAVVPSKLIWSDVGTWASLYDLLSAKTKNHTISRGNHLGIGDKNCLIYAQDKLLATVGLENIIIVDTPDITLVCNKDQSQDVKKLIEIIKRKGMTKYL